MKKSDDLFPSEFRGLLLIQDYPGHAWLLTLSLLIGRLFTTDYATCTCFMAAKRLVMD